MSTYEKGGLRLMPTRDTRKLTLTVSAQVGDRLDEMSKRRGITISELLRRSIATQSIIDKAIDEYGELVIARKDPKTAKSAVHQLDALV